MEVRCIKTYGSYWGEFYEKDKWYKIVEEVTFQRTLITDELSYYKALNVHTSQKDLFLSGLNEQQISERVEGFLTLKQIMDLYTTKVDIPYYIIHGNLDVAGHLSFVSLTPNQVEELYGSSKFDTTEKYFSEYFRHGSDMRDKIIDDILKS